MVTKVSARNHGGEVRLKAAASFAEAGDIHDVVDELWQGPGAKKKTLIDTVSVKCFVQLFSFQAEADRRRKSTSF
jgi:hypothetical protein